MTDTTPGPDGMSNKMIKHLPQAAEMYILRIFNRCYREEYFPERWKMSQVIPIPKPDKQLDDPRNYRPISLRSSLCKAMVRLVNSRLIDYLEKQEDFAVIQTGENTKKIDDRSAGEN